MRGRLGDNARLKHILDAIVEIESYLIDTDYEAFLNNSIMRLACIKQMDFNLKNVIRENCINCIHVNQSRNRK